jgi:multiple sugar transport system substrate-binding protein
MAKLSFFQIVILSVFGALAIGGVMIFAFVVGGSGGEGIGEVEIWGTLDAGAFSVVLRQLSDEDSRLKAVTYVQKDEATFSRDVTDALASGSGPDLFILRNDYAERDGAKAVSIPFASFSEEQFQNTFIEAASPFVGGDGIRGVPFAADPLVLYWNRDLMGSAGFSQAPQYWGDFYDIASKATKRDDTNTVQKSGVALGEYTNVNHAKDVLAVLILQAGGRITSRDSAGKLSTALVSRAGDTQQPSESAIRFFTEFANPIKTYYSWNRARPDSRQAFATGDLALYLGLASEEPLIRRLNPNLNFSVAPVPQIKGSNRSLDVAHVYAFAVPKASANQQGALTVAYLLASQKPSQLLSQALGIPSARRDVLAMPLSGRDDLFNKQAIIARSWTDPDPEKTDAIFRDMIESITSGAARLSEAIQRADQAMTQLMSI